MKRALRQRIAAVLLWVGAASLGSALAQKLPDNPGRELFEAICTECHTTERVAAQHKTRAEWRLKVTEMLQEESDVTEAERATIINYLAASFPKADRINVNKASANELETNLQLIRKEADAIVRYRQEKGAFQTLEDLKKVPGIDASKIDANKERLDFQ